MNKKIKNRMLQNLEASNKIQQEIAGNIWDLFSVANLNSSYVHGMIESAAREPYKEMDVVMVLHESDTEQRDEINSILAMEDIKSRINSLL